MEIGFILKRIRENKKISQQEVADFLDISQRTYSNIESNKSKISLTQVLKLNQFLDFDIKKVIQKLGFIYEKKDYNNANHIEKLISKYETHIKDLQEFNVLLKEKIDRLEKR